MIFSLFRRPLSGSGSQRTCERLFCGLILCSTASWVAPAAFGATPVATDTSGASKAGRPAAVAPARAAKRTAAPRSINAGAAEEMRVRGRRETHAAQTIVTMKTFANAVPGTSVMKALEQVPGVMFATDDAQGLDPSGTQLMMHGFDQTQIGFTLDGVPLGETGYRNYNGLNVYQAASSENIAQVEVSQAAGALSMPSTNSLGGGIEIRTRDPSHKAGGYISQTFGSYNMYHTFIRADSGDLTPSGTRFFVSYMRNDGDKWKGYGDQFVQQVNAKLLQPIGESSNISIFFDWSNLAQYAYQAESLEMINKLGSRVDYYYPDYHSAYLAAQGIYSHHENLVSDAKDVSWYTGTTTETDYLGGLNLHLQMTDNLRWNTVIYGHGEQSATEWSDPYLASPGTGAPLSEIVKMPQIERFGLTSNVEYDISKHHMRAGIWYENNKYISNMYGYDDPVWAPGVQPDPYRSWKNPFAELWGQTYNTNTFVGFIEDSWRPVDSLILHAGFKSMMSTTRVSATANTPSYTGTDQIAGGVGLTAEDAFLPHFSAEWHFLTYNSLFFDVSKNMRSYPQSGYHLAASPFAVSQTAFDNARSSIKPEKDWVYSVGWRFNHPIVSASVIGYHVDFSNRLQASVTGSSINPVTTVMNVGGVTMNGVDAGVTVRPLKGLSIFNSISYNHSTYDSNLNEVGTVYPIKGKKVIDYPQLMYKASAMYEFRHATVHLDANYIGRRPLSYLNDTWVPGYWLATLGAKYDFGDLWHLKGLTASFNVNNLFNTTYVSMMGGQGGSPMEGDYQTLLMGAPRMFFGTISSNF